MTIEQAITLAAKWHAGQTDKAGQPYIYHLLRVCLGAPLQYCIPAVLHDILEDTEIGRLTLHVEGVSLMDQYVIWLLSRKGWQGETYAEHIDRIIESGSDAALYVKQADLIDHLYNNPFPIRSESHKERYVRALDLINEEAIRRRLAEKEGS